MKKKLFLSVIFSFMFILLPAMFLSGCTNGVTLNEGEWKSALYLTSSKGFTVSHEGKLYDQKGGTELRDFEEEFQITDTACKIYQKTTGIENGDVIEQTYYYDLDCGYWYMYEKQADGTYTCQKISSTAILTPYQWVENYIFIYKNQFDHFNKVGDHYNMSAGDNSVDVYIEKVERTGTNGSTYMSYEVKKIDLSLAAQNPDFPEAHYQVSTMEIVDIGSTTIEFPANMLVDHKEYRGGFVAANTREYTDPEGHAYGKHIAEEDGINGDYPLVFITEDEIMFGGNANLNLITLPYTTTREGKNYKFNVTSNVISDVEFIPGQAKYNSNSNNPSGLEVWSGEGRYIEFSQNYSYNFDTLKYKVNGVQFVAYVAGKNVNMVGTDDGNEGYTPLTLVYIERQTNVNDNEYYYVDCIGTNAILKVKGTEIKEETLSNRNSTLKVYIADDIKICEIQDFTYTDPNGAYSFSYNAKTSKVTSLVADKNMYFSAYDLYNRLAISGSEEYGYTLHGWITYEDLTDVAIRSFKVQHDIEQVGANGIITRYQLVNNDWRVNQ